MMTILVSKKASRRARAPKVKATELRKQLWKMFGHRCAMVKTEKRDAAVVIHVKVPAKMPPVKYNKMCTFLTAWDECLDAPDKQIINIVRI